jgi:uncharacterized surface protein with fasciclin (FAS1) repeats
MVLFRTLLSFGLIFFIGRWAFAQQDTTAIELAEKLAEESAENVSTSPKPLSPTELKQLKKEENRKRRAWLDSTKAVRDEKYQALLETMVYQTRDLEQLTDRNTFTLFAPNNDAFKRVPIKVFDYLMKPDNIRALEEMITYHVVDKELTGKEIRRLIKKNGGSYLLTTLGGIKLLASLGESGELLLFDEERSKLIKVTAEDWKTEKGQIHVIDQVLIPYRFLN